MKRYIPHPLQLEAILNGSRLMVVKIDWMLFKYTGNTTKFKQGDDIYIGEEFVNYGDIVMYKQSLKELNADWQPASEMTYEQPRLRFTVGEVSVKSVSELDYDDYCNLGLPSQTDFIEVITKQEKVNWLKSQAIEPTDYVVLVEIKEK